MTDRRLALAVDETASIERQARSAWEAAAQRLDYAERDAALHVMRQAIGLKTVLEQWITSRARRAAHSMTT